MIGLNIDGHQTVDVDAMKSRNRSMQHVEFEYYPETTVQSTDKAAEDKEKIDNVAIDATRMDVRQQLEEHLLSSLNELFDTSSKNGKLAIEHEIDRVIHSLPPTSAVTFNVQESIGRVLTLKEGLDSSRHYNFDFSPKLLTCRGDMVEVLIKSGIGRYLEFKGVEQSFVYDTDSKTFDKVPVSKEDVFSTDSIALIDKRKLMRFLTFAMNDEENAQDLGEYESKPFKALLEEKFKINGKLQMAIIYAIALIQDDESKVMAKEGLERTTSFLKSLGRFGKCAFLRPLYGGASEVAQAFCRACAVHGGVYMLNQPVKKYLLNEDKSQCVGIVTGEGQQIKSKWIIGSMEYMNKEWLDVESTEQEASWISRAIIVSSQPPIINEASDTEDLSFAVFPPSQADDLSRPVTAIQLSSEGMACPRKKYMTFLSISSTDPEKSSKTDLASAVDKLQKSNNEMQPLFVLYYKQRSQQSSVIASDKAPKNIVACSDPDSLLDLDAPLAEARKTFAFCVGVNEEFLPAPDVDPELEE
ncbi:hypothetical protein VKS41_004640 [Umbelopsis sp. WA50703]